MKIHFEKALTVMKNTRNKHSSVGFLYQCFSARSGSLLRNMGDSLVFFCPHLGFVCFNSLSRTGTNSEQNEFSTML